MTLEEADKKAIEMNQNWGLGHNCAFLGRDCHHACMSFVPAYAYTPSILDCEDVYLVNPPECKRIERGL